MMQNPILEALSAAGVSVWLDDLSRDRLRSGSLQQLIEHRLGGLGSAVLESVAISGTSPLWLGYTVIRVMPRLGTLTELLTSAAIGAASIDSTARHLLDGTPPQSDRQDASTLAAQRRSAAPT
jgi:hypothetical protein